MSIVGATAQGRLFIATIGLLLSLSSPAVNACECLWQGSFSEVAPSADLVVLGTVETAKGNAIDVTVDVTLSGPDWIDRPRVWLKTGDYCRPEIGRFEETERFIFALTKITALPDDGFNPLTPNVSYGRVGDYELSSCGGYWLSINGLRASGNIVPGMPRYSHDPQMSPVHVGHVIAYLKGKATLASLAEAAERDPELESLKRDSKRFLRGPDSTPPDR